MAKKRGRKKKRGPKKKKIQNPHTYVGLKRPYHIITTNNGVQLEDIHSCVSLNVALKKLKDIQSNFIKSVQFPVKYVSNKQCKTFVEADYQLMLIKRKDGNETTEGKFKNDFGKYIDCTTDNDEWLFIESVPYQLEETFWVYGYNPKRQRKTYDFILNEYVLYHANDKYFFKEIVIFKNKLLIDSVDGMEMVICKNHADSVRLYNEIERYTTDNKLKYILFAGDIGKKSYSFQRWFDKIKELTNWPDRKIKKNTTRD